MGSEKIATRSKVTLDYSISFADGSEVVSTYGEEPLVFSIGDGTMAEKLEQCLLGLAEGSEALFMLSGDEVFGPSLEANIQRIDKTEFPPEMMVSTGQLIGFTTPAGDELAGLVESLTDNEVVVNFNHPLCGHRIRFKVTILKVESSAALLE